MSGPRDGGIHVPYVTARLPKWPGAVHDKAGSNMLGGVVLPTNSPVHGSEIVGSESTRDNLHVEGAQRAEDQTPYMRVVEDSMAGFRRRLDLLEEGLDRVMDILTNLRRTLAQYVQTSLPRGTANPFAE